MQAPRNFLLPTGSRSPILGGPNYKGEMVQMNGRKIVFDKKPGQVGWVEQDIVDKCVAESLQGLDAKLGIRRTCPVKGVV